MSSGTGFGPMAASSCFARSSMRAACAVSSDGNRVDSNCGLDSVTTRSVRSVLVANATSRVPSAGVLAPTGVTPTAMRVLSVRRSGHDTTCGWYTVAVPFSPVITCGQASPPGAARAKAGAVCAAAAGAAADAAGAAPPPTARSACWHPGDVRAAFFCRHCSAALPPVGTPAQFAW